MSFVLRGFDGPPPYAVGAPVFPRTVLGPGSWRGSPSRPPLAPGPAAPYNAASGSLRAQTQRTPQTIFVPASLAGPRGGGSNEGEIPHEHCRDVVAQGGVVLFVGTKKQAAETVRTAAERVNMPYVTFRWLGGMLTNWDTMRQRVKYLLDLEARRDRGEFAMLPKKEALLLEREITKLNQRLGGIKAMTTLPDMLFIVDTHRESIAVSEANKLGIKVAGMVDTNSDPDLVDFVIPANDDAIRAIKLIADKVANGVQDGMTMRESAFVEEMTASEAEAVDTSQRVFDPFEEEAAAEAETAEVPTSEPETESAEVGADGPAAAPGEAGAETSTKAAVTDAPTTGESVTDQGTTAPVADAMPAGTDGGAPSA
ncbi:MAG: 30S ribosomal protein S2 [Anaerolineae bacterium]